MCDATGKKCNTGECKCNSISTVIDLKVLLSQYEKELSECIAAMKRTENSLDQLRVQKQQLIGARFAIESAINSINKKEEVQDGKE